MTAITSGAGLSFSLLILGIIIFICVLLNSESSKRGVPMLLAFIVFGIVCGNIGRIPVYLDDKHLAAQACTIALIFIMFYGGFGTRWKAARSVAVESGLLATVGVLITAALTGMFCHYALRWNWNESLLLGAVVSSTDAASVFSVLRGSSLGLKNHTASILEIESGSNDPAAYMLTAVMISIINGNASAGHVAGMVLSQIGVGTVCGLLIAQAGVHLMRRVSFPTSGFDSLMVFAIALGSYAIPDMLGGNGYLSAYIVGIVMGNNSFPGRKKLIGFFDGINGLMQVMIFFILGLLARPALLWKALLPALAITFALLLVARPLTVAGILTPFKRYPWKQQGLITFAGLRGASAIVFAIVASSGCTALEHDIFSTVFCIVLISIALEGTMIPKVADWLGMIDHKNDVMMTFSDFANETALQFSRLDIEEGSSWDGKQLKDIRMPKGMLICRIAKPSPEDPSKKIRIIPDGETVMNAGDIIIVCSQAYESDKELHILEKEIGPNSKWIGQTIEAHAEEKKVQVLLIQRGDQSIIPNGTTIIQAGDIFFMNQHMEPAQ